MLHVAPRRVLARYPRPWPGTAAPGWEGFFPTRGGGGQELGCPAWDLRGRSPGWGSGSPMQLGGGTRLGRERGGRLLNAPKSFVSFVGQYTTLPCREYKLHMQSFVNLCAIWGVSSFLDLSSILKIPFCNFITILHSTDYVMFVGQGFVSVKCHQNTQKSFLALVWSAFLDCLVTRLQTSNPAQTIVILYIMFSLTHTDRRCLPSLCCFGGFNSLKWMARSCSPILLVWAAAKTNIYT